MILNHYLKVYSCHYISPHLYHDEYWMVFSILAQTPAYKEITSDFSINIWSIRF
jgi:hypothetical protein